MKKIKRVFLIFISVCIFGITIYSDYQTVKAVDIPTAFWGTLEASRAFWTALQAGGGVRGGGVSTAAFEHSSREDMHDLQVQVLLAYTAFCIWKEKAALKIAHPDWTEEQINQQAEVDGRLASDRFQNSAINVSDTTKNLTIKDYGYWREFCDTLHSINNSGITGGEIGENTIVKPPFYNYTDAELNNKTSIGGNCIEIDNNYYVSKGTYYRLFPSQKILYNSESTYDRINLYYILSFIYDNSLRMRSVHIIYNALKNELIYYDYDNDYWALGGSFSETVENTDFPYYVCNSLSEAIDVFNRVRETWKNELKVTDNDSTEKKDYENMLENALNNTEAGKAIKEGADNGQEEIVKSGAIPVKRSTVKTGEETATGAVGWDVPDARTLEGAIAVPDTQDDVVEGMGIITVPEDVVRPKSDDTVAEWAKDEPISIPDTKDEPISKPIDDVISDQYGDYYPTQVSLADFFPFCIPFDIYYCVQKFNVGQGEAPVIHIPIVYPKKLQGALGESYDVIIDFNNYIALRNIIRAFILIFFLVGLMQVTRNLIRG